MDKTTGQDGKSRDSPAKPCTVRDTHRGRKGIRYGFTHAWLLIHAIVGGGGDLGMVSHMYGSLTIQIHPDI